MAPLMIIGTVPLYNVMAVVILSVLKPERGKVDKALLLKTGKGIVTNPIILGILAGMIWSGLRLPMPKILDKTVSNVGVLATPLGLMALGASFSRKAPQNGQGFLGLILLGRGMLTPPRTQCLTHRMRREHHRRENRPP